MKQQLLTLLVIISTLHCGFSQNQEERYHESYALLNKMITDTANYSFRKAVFSIENTYLNGRLDTAFINKEIRKLNSITASLVENRYMYYPDERDRKTVTKWASVYSVLCDTIPLIIEKNLIYRHFPFGYDFNDVFGHEDYTSLFVSKLLASKKGNCKSLPYLYKILAEELNVSAHLALAPNHIYIKHQSNHHGWFNTELTSGIFPIDAWLTASGFVHVDAITNGVYLKALNDKESIALLLVDLANAYQRSFPENDGNFILQCAERAIEVYPNFAGALLLQAETHKKQFEQEQDQSKANTLFVQLQEEYAHIHELGYRHMPEEMYLNWLVSLKTERETYENKKIDTFNQD